METSAAPLWKRETPWRQGHVLDRSAVEAIGLCHPAEPAASCVVVITHDCDLANDNLAAEPEVEVIVGCLVDAPNGNFSWGKAPRTLHLSMRRAGKPVTVELVATSKRRVAKAALAAYQPDADFDLGSRGLAVMRSWLSARYQRGAFPDTFVSRMAATKLDSKLAKLVEPYGDLISFIYFDIDSGRISERAEGEPYGLSIVLVFPPGDDPETSQDQAEELVEKVLAVAAERLTNKGTGANTGHIVLERCFAISEDDLPVSRARVLMHWRLEHMSLKSDDEQPGPPAV